MTPTTIIEHKGMLWIPSSTQPFDQDELWFVIRNKACKAQETNVATPALAHVWRAKQTLGCVYSPDVEEQVSHLESNLYVKHVNGTSYVPPS